MLTCWPLAQSTTAFKEVQSLTCLTFIYHVSLTVFPRNKLVTLVTHTAQYTQSLIWWPLGRSSRAGNRMPKITQCIPESTLRKCMLLSLYLFTELQIPKKGICYHEYRHNGSTVKLNMSLVDWIRSVKVTETLIYKYWCNGKFLDYTTWNPAVQ